LKIERASADDIKGLVHISFLWAQEMGYDVGEKEILDDLARTQEKGVVLMAIKANEVVGMMTGLVSYHFWTKEHTAHEHWLFVDPKHRESGVASMMLFYFVEWARAGKCQSVILSPNKFGSRTPEKSRQRLETMGFELHGYTLRKEL